MSDSTIARSLHDLGAAGWFGSVLMGAVAVNRAAGDTDDPVAAGRFTNGVWSRWWVVNAVCIGAHLAGGAMLTKSNAPRLVAQRGAAGTTAVKSVLTIGAFAASVYSGLLGKRISEAGEVPLSDATTPTDDTPPEIARAVNHQAVLQWVIPALTAGIIATGARHGEQQRVSQVAHGVLGRLTPGS